MTQFDIVLGSSLMPLLLNALDCRSMGKALTNLPLMIDATKAGVAILFRNKSTERGALTIVPSLLLEAYTCT